MLHVGGPLDGTWVEDRGQRRALAIEQTIGNYSSTVTYAARTVRLGDVMAPVLCPATMTDKDLLGLLLRGYRANE